MRGLAAPRRRGAARAAPCRRGAARRRLRRRRPGAASAIPQSLYKYVALLGSLAFLACVDRLPEHRPRPPARHARPHGRDAGAPLLPAQRRPRRSTPSTCTRCSRRCRCRISRPCSASLLAMPLAWFASCNMTPSRRFGYQLGAARHHGVPLGARDDLDDPARADARLRHAARRAGADALLHRLRRQAVLRGDRGDRPGQVEAIRATGGNQLQVFVFAVLPQVRVAWTGISIYTWDVVFRAATVVGFFGAGGMGWYLRESVQRDRLAGRRRDPALDHRRRRRCRAVLGLAAHAHRRARSPDANATEATNAQ